MKSGIVIINKEPEMTSQKVVSNVKRILNIKKAGHIGTLDPLATGVLPVLIGNATKLSKYLIDHDKTYIATVKLGIHKDTGDEEGHIIQERLVPNLDEAKIQKILQEMKGKQKQAPHPYSAVKVDGKKLYEYARKGEKVEVPLRDIEIYDLNLLKWDEKQKEINFYIACSKGTYVRVICEDLAEKLGTCGYMKFLRRTSVGRFQIENAVTLEELSEKNIISIEELCQDDYEEIELSDSKLILFLNGVRLNLQKQDGIYRIYHNLQFIGLGTVEDGLLKRDIVVV